MIEKIAPKASNGHEYIPMAIDYFFKWVEATFYFILKAKHVAQFLENNIICWFGASVDIAFCTPYDSGPHSQMMLEL